MEDEPIEGEIALRSNESRDYPIRGMGSVVATVSGYHGAQRFKLIKLINYTGANYVGALTKSTTHLVCWRFEGRKYDFAKNFGITIITHRWFEDCARKWKRLPENCYMMHSGHEVGPFSWEMPVACKKDNLLTGKKGNVLSDRSNVRNHSTALEIDKGNMQSGSRLHNEHEESSSHSSMRVMRHKRNVCSTSGSTATIEVEPTRKGRRLVKKNVCRDIMESAVLVSEKEFSPTGTCNGLENIPASSNDSNILRNENALTSLNCEQECSPMETCNVPGNISSASNDLRDLSNENTIIPLGTALEDGFRSGENGNEEPEGIEGIMELNNMSASNYSNMLTEDVLLAQGRASLDMFSNFEENMNEEPKNVGEFREETGLPTSTGLSCVICWTDFSLTRGVLPCGHRFCYSCIQEWSDHMASRRKASTCPLCKASFASITRVDSSADSDQKIYSQSIPHALPATDIFVLPDWESSRFSDRSSAASVCCACRSRETEDLLISCHLCQSRCIHSYCLDPPLVPWTCIHCRDLRSLYHRFR